MSTSKNSLRWLNSPVQTNTHSASSKIIHWVCAALFAGLILFGSSAMAQNVLLNPGCESNSLAGWYRSIDGDIYPVTTSGLSCQWRRPMIYLAHSSSLNAFQMFNTTASSGLYVSGLSVSLPRSLYLSSVYVTCYTSNLFDTAFTYMSVAFYNANNQVLDQSGGTANPGVYCGFVIDPTYHFGSLYC